VARAVATTRGTAPSSTPAKRSTPSGSLVERASARSRRRPGCVEKRYLST
jgi:hypothetical protein